MSACLGGIILVALGGLLAACSGEAVGFNADTNPDASPGTSEGGRPDPGPDAGFVWFDTGPGQIEGGGGGPTRDPITCEEAAAAKSYIGCDYWPTVVANNVWSIFDYAVVVANTGATEATVTITGPNGFSQSGTVAANGLTKFYLPWVKELKGPDTDSRGTATPVTSSAIVRKGAYHLVTSVPVTVYQFNALEYGPSGGPSGKDWSKCPAAAGMQCFSYSNDASLLLPSTAMTGNYRVAGIYGWTESNIIQTVHVMGSYASITATQDGTNVTMQLPAKGGVVAGGGITAKRGGETLTLSLNAGDVARVQGGLGSSFDLSGALITTNDKPIQVITGIPCINLPAGKGACDHIEESVFPAETLGKHYLVTRPTGPFGKAVNHIVRIYGNRDNTKLTYAPSRPTGCPTTINAGQVAECGSTVASDFEITGDNEFLVGTFMLGASAINTTDLKGDPSFSLSTAVEQYRTKYVFLAPDDYDVNYVDIVAPKGASITLDGSPVTATFTTVGSLSVARVKLGDGKNGAHVMQGDQPFGIQVLGYGENTSYQYPGGLNLGVIAPPPPPK